MKEMFSRTARVYGEDAVRKLNESTVAVFGVGGVGGYVVEALARSGVGRLILVDDDRVCESNLNRQIIATRSTIGRYKVDAAKERILDINPDCEVEIHKCFYLPETKDRFDFSAYDYVVDAIDTVTGKIQLVLQAREAGTPIISAMGAGNKIHPELFEVADISETSVCPLARIMRKELKKRGVEHLKVVYSKEFARTPIGTSEEAEADFEAYAVTGANGDPAANEASEKSIEPLERKGPGSRRSTPGSTPFTPAVAGLLMAAEIVNDLTGESRQSGKRTQ